MTEGVLAPSVLVVVLVVFLRWPSHTGRNSCSPSRTSQRRRPAASCSRRSLSPRPRRRPSRRPCWLLSLSPCWSTIRTCRTRSSCSGSCPCAAKRIDTLRGRAAPCSTSRRSCNPTEPGPRQARPAPRLRPPSAQSTRTRAIRRTPSCGTRHSGGDPNCRASTRTNRETRVSGSARWRGERGSVRCPGQQSGRAPRTGQPRHCVEAAAVGGWSA